MKISNCNSISQFIFILFLLFFGKNYDCSTDTSCSSCASTLKCDACSGDKFLLTAERASQVCETDVGSLIGKFGDGIFTSCCVDDCPSGTSPVFGTVKTCILCHDDCEGCYMGADDSNPEDYCYSCSDPANKVHTEVLTDCSSSKNCFAGECASSSCSNKSLLGLGSLCIPSNCGNNFVENSGVCETGYQCTNEPDCTGCDSLNEMSKSHCFQCTAGKKLFITDGGEKCNPMVYDGLRQCCFDTCPDYLDDDGNGNCIPKTTCDLSCTGCTSIGNSFCTGCTLPPNLVLVHTADYGTCEMVPSNFQVDDTSIYFSDKCPEGMETDSGNSKCLINYQCSEDVPSNVEERCDVCDQQNIVTKIKCSGCRTGAKLIVHDEAYTECIPQLFSPVQTQCCYITCPTDYYEDGNFCKPCNGGCVATTEEDSTTEEDTLEDTTSEEDNTDECQIGEYLTFVSTNGVPTSNFVCTEDCSHSYKFEEGDEKYCFTDKKCPPGLVFSKIDQICKTVYNCEEDEGCSGCDTSNSLTKSRCSECESGFNLVVLKKGITECLMSDFPFEIGSCCFSECPEIILYSDPTCNLCYFYLDDLSSIWGLIILVIISGIVGSMCTILCCKNCFKCEDKEMVRINPGLSGSSFFDKSTEDSKNNMTKSYSHTFGLEESSYFDHSQSNFIQNQEVSELPNAVPPQVVTTFGKKKRKHTRKQI